MESAQAESMVLTLNGLVIEANEIKIALLQIAETLGNMDRREARVT